MQINLSELRRMHPRLSEELVRLMTERAGFGLQRNRHVSPVTISLNVERVLTQGQLTWPNADISTLNQHDADRITEDGAEAIALAHAHQAPAGRSATRTFLELVAEAKVLGL